MLNKLGGSNYLKVNIFDKFFFFLERGCSWSLLYIYSLSLELTDTLAWVIMRQSFNTLKDQALPAIPTLSISKSLLSWFLNSGLLPASQRGQEVSHHSLHTLLLNLLCPALYVKGSLLSSRGPLGYDSFRSSLDFKAQQPLIPAFSIISPNFIYF